MEQFGGSLEQSGGSEKQFGGIVKQFGGSVDQSSKVWSNPVKCGAIWGLYEVQIQGKRGVILGKCELIWGKFGAILEKCGAIWGK